MTPSIATAVAVASFMTALAAGMFALGLARGPGWGHLRNYAFASFGAALFAASDVVLTAAPVGEEGLVWAARFNSLAAGFHVAFWIRFFASWERRPLNRLERWTCNVAFVGGVAQLVPGLAITGPITERTLEGLGITYHDATLNAFAVVFYLVGAFALALIVFPAWRLARVKRSAWGLAFAFCVMAVAVLNDILSVTHVIPTPYLINAAHIGLTIGIGITVIAELVANARALEETSARLEQTRAELVERERLAALGELAAVVAHEVRNPLAVLFNALASLKHSGLAEADRRTLLAMIEDEAERLRRLVEALLDFVRPYEPRLTRQEPGLLVARAAEQALAVVRCASDQVAIESHATGALTCDRDLIQQAVANLIVNALQAPSRKSPVRVRVESEAGKARVAVIDDGRGVPSELEGQLFTPFFTTRQTGTGLGLALVKRIADSHHGSVTHQPTPGGGATFILDLPARENALAHPPAAGP